jgi:ABC-type nitrate/sulfonate/bicarbonate transport system substrate-binding protein
MFNINQRRRTLLSTAAAFTGVSLLGLTFGKNASAAGHSLFPFRVGLSAQANTCLAIWMAEDAGFYKNHGLDFSEKRMLGGSQTGPALSSGDIQAMHIGSSSVVRANGNGYHLRTVAALRNVLSFTMFTRPEVKSAAELKGGVIGITSIGSESDAALGVVLSKIGLTRSDITIKEFGTDAARTAALKEGSIVATMLNEPSRSNALAMGLNPIVDPLADHLPWVFTGLVVDAAYLEKHRDVLIRFLKATLEGNYLALTNESRAKSLLAKKLDLTDPKIIEVVYQDFKTLSPRDIEVSSEGIKNIIAQVAKDDASHDPKDYVDTSLLASIRKEGFMTGLKRKYKLS